MNGGSGYGTRIGIGGAVLLITLSGVASFQASRAIGLRANRWATADSLRPFDLACLAWVPCVVA